MRRVVVTLTDQGYAAKAKRTIMDIRSRGQWTEDLVLITVGFDMPATFMDFYHVIPFRVEHLDCSTLLEKYKACPIRPTCDNRQYDKLTQWDKFYVFDPWFAQWDTVLYVDAGLRVLDTVSLLMDLPCESALMAPDDAAPMIRRNDLAASLKRTETRRPWRPFGRSIVLRFSRHGIS